MKRLNMRSEIAEAVWLVQQTFFEIEKVFWEVQKTLRTKLENWSNTRAEADNSKMDIKEETRCRTTLLWEEWCAKNKWSQKPGLWSWAVTVALSLIFER